MTKHTPEPWILNQGSNNYSVTTKDSKIKIIEGCRNPIANLELWEQRLANARLIAAAPELLKACKKFKLWYQTLSHMNPDSFIVLKKILPNEIINKLEEAILKAKEM